MQDLRLIIKIFLSLLTWYKIILQEIGSSCHLVESCDFQSKHVNIDRVDKLYNLSIHRFAIRAKRGAERCGEIWEEIIFRGYYFPTWRRGAAVNNKTNERSESWQMRGEYQRYSQRCSYTSGGRRWPVSSEIQRYNGPTIFNCSFCWNNLPWIITLKDMQGVGKEWLIRKMENYMLKKKSIKSWTKKRSIKIPSPFKANISSSIER